MAYLIGTDEAGYGPNLGPLVISATVWRVPDKSLRRDLYETLADCVHLAPSECQGNGKVPIADSKKLYQPGHGLNALELGVLTALAAIGARVSRWREVFRLLDESGADAVAGVPWHRDYDLELPCAVTREQLEAAARCFMEGLHRAGVSLVAMRSAVIFPAHWNDLLDQHESKGAALSHCTLGLVRELLAMLAPAPALVVCDKHGGRNRYGPLLQHFFPDAFVESRGEGRAVSVYRWGPPATRTEVQFVAKGESFLPSALASMTSKYLRELAMLAFNDFWGKQKPGLRPTAGYPGDASRFHREICDLTHSLGIADRQLWRNK